MPAMAESSKRGLPGPQNSDEDRIKDFRKRSAPLPPGLELPYGTTRKSLWRPSMRVHGIASCASSTHHFTGIFRQQNAASIMTAEGAE